MPGLSDKYTSDKYTGFEAVKNVKNVYKTGDFVIISALLQEMLSLSLEKKYQKCVDGKLEATREDGPDTRTLADRAEEMVVTVFLKKKA